MENFYLQKVNTKKFNKIFIILILFKSKADCNEYLEKINYIFN